MTIQTDASAVDSALASLDAAVAAYLATASSLDSTHRGTVGPLSGGGIVEHPIYSNAVSYVQAAARRHLTLARTLGLAHPSTTAPTLASQHP